MSINFTVKTDKFRSILSTALLHKSDSLLESVHATFNSLGMKIKDISLEVVAVVIDTSTNFFQTYDVKEETHVLLTNSLFSILDKRFKNIETINITIDDSKIYIKSVPTETRKQGPEYDEDLLSVHSTDFPIEIIKTDYGLLPVSAIDKSKIIIEVPVSDFLNMPDARIYTLIAKDNKSKLHSKDVGNFYSPLTPKSITKCDDLTVSFSSNYFDRLTSNLSGNINFLVGEGACNLTQNSDELRVSLMLTTMETDTQ